MASGYPDFEGAKSKLYSGADWSAIEAYDKNVSASWGPTAFGANWSTTYTIPVGKTFYLNQMSIVNIASAAADGDSNQMCLLILDEVVGGGTSHQIGGNGGASIVFAKPIVFTAGQQLRLRGYNYANHNTTVVMSYGGYEL